MNNKVSILTITAILTVIIFFISTYMQKRLINYEPTVECLVLNQNIMEHQKLSEDMFKVAGMPISLVSNTRIIQTYSEIDGMYAKDNIYKSQIAVKEQFDTKENLSIYEAEEGKEKLSIKISSAENGMSYAIKSNSLVNIYATIRNDYANNFLNEKERLMIGDEYDGYTVIKILDKVKVLGAFNVDGIEVENSTDGIIDTIMIAVSNEEAKQINLIREIASFNITGITENINENLISNTLENSENINLSENISN